MRTFIKLSFIILVTGMSGVTAAEPMKEIVLEALHSMAGTSQGTLEGPSLEQVLRVAPVDEPIMVKVRTLKRYQQEGCGRLEVEYTGKLNRASGHPGKKITLAKFEMNLCKDGTAPRETLTGGQNTD